MKFGTAIFHNMLPNKLKCCENRLSGSHILLWPNTRHYQSRYCYYRAYSSQSRSYMGASVGYWPAQHLGRRICRTGTAKRWHKIRGSAWRSRCNASLRSGDRISLGERFSATVETWLGLA